MEIKEKSINTLRILSVDMIQNANSGHPGMPLGCSPMLYILFSNFLKFSNNNINWINRDRFILSNGHGCALLYSLLYLFNYNMTMNDLKNFRKLHSNTPGHPEKNIKNMIDVTTGPLGQGIANGVGMAIAYKNLSEKFNKNDCVIFNNKIYVSCGDGCLMEGITNEAMSLAGHLKLNNLIILYDDNKISIDGSTDLTFTENTFDKYNAMGWNVLVVEDGNNDLVSINNKINIAQNSNKPVLIMIRTTIGYGTSKENSEKSHGTPIGEEDIINLKLNCNFDPTIDFYIPYDVMVHFNNLISQKNYNYTEWCNTFEYYKKSYIEDYNILKNFITNKINSLNSLPTFTDNDKSMATREISGLCLQSIHTHIPQLIGGSADLSPSNNTKIGNVLDFNNYSGKYIHYGVREHAMCAIANGISTCGFIPYVGTFLVFITYCIGAIRMAALSKHQVIYILTHDSIGLGEDGPTHQPIESLTILRSIPNLLTFRPADGKEVVGTYEQALTTKDKPSAIILSRQKLPQLVFTNSNMVCMGGYTLKKGENIILIATGSEVSLAINVMKELEKDGLSVGVVSMPCCELFDIQSKEYKEQVLPLNIIKISIEAGSTLGWYKYANYCIGIDTFGSSGDGDEVMDYFGFSVKKIKDKINLFIKFI